MMAMAAVNGIELAYEITGEGFPVVWCHQFGDDSRGWEPQVKFFSRHYRNVTYNQRGYPPSSAPAAPEAYSHQLLLVDLVGLLDHLDIRRAHVVGISMGGSVALNLALNHPERCASVVIAGAGIDHGDSKQNEREVERLVNILNTQGMQAFVASYRDTPSHHAFRRKDPKGWREYNQRFLDMSAQVAANSQLRIRLARNALLASTEPLKRLRTPTLIMVGDEDAAALEPALMMKREIPGAGLAVFPQSGHSINLEEPALFNQTILNFFHMVENDKWVVRDRA